MTDNGHQNTALTARQEQFGGMMTQGVGETAALAIAAQAKAAVEARWIVAMRAPRDLDQVRVELLRECKRPAFAEVARYFKPIGQGITGPSIRFVEAAMQAYGNCDSEAITIYDDDRKRIVEVRVTDFQRNITHRKQITVTKTVERKFLRKDQTAISSRTNSSGDITYLVAATDDDLLNKEGALISKALRTCGLRLIPGWLTEECMTQVVETQQNQAAQDPDAERNRLASAFAELNVQPAELATYLDHDLGKVSPAEITELRQIYATIRDGQANWQDILGHRLSQRGEAPAETPAVTQPAQRGTQAVKDAMRQSVAPAPAATSQTPQEPPQPAQTQTPPVRAPDPATQPKAEPAPQPPTQAAEPPPPPPPSAGRPLQRDDFALDQSRAIDVEATEEGESFDAQTGELFTPPEPPSEPTAQPTGDPMFQEPSWMKAPEPPAPKGTGKPPPSGEGF